MKLSAVFVILCVPLIASADDETFTALLRQHVTNGIVRYKELCADSRLEEYTGSLKRANPDSLANDKTRLAFWINAYNAYTLKAICTRYPIKSINELHSGGLVIGTVLNTTIWDKDFVIINQKPTTLNYIEHKIIRPLFKDARIHFALVCAAKSCPPLRSEAYEGAKLDTQLDDQARIFLTDVRQNHFDTTEKRAYISKILDWYGKDFGENTAERLLHLARYLPAEVAASIKKEPDKWQVKYNNYDWSLNE